MDGSSSGGRYKATTGYKTGTITSMFSAGEGAGLFSNTRLIEQLQNRIESLETQLTDGMNRKQRLIILQQLVDTRSELLKVLEHQCIG